MSEKHLVCDYQAHLIKKNNFVAPFYGWGSSVSRPVLLRGDSLTFTIKSTGGPGNHLIDLGKMNG